MNLLIFFANFLPATVVSDLLARVTLPVSLELKWSCPHFFFWSFLFLVILILFATHWIVFNFGIYGFRGVLEDSRQERSLLANSLFLLALI